ncbi:MAG: conserved hypothetical protein [Methanobrevibacter sp. CfCl-M3]
MGGDFSVELPNKNSLFGGYEWSEYRGCKLLWRVFNFS